MKFAALSLLASLGLLVFGAGCASPSSGYSARMRQARDFEIVETSTKRTLTAQEMAHLRAKVTDYLEREGATESGDYYLKIYLGTEDGMPEGEWVVVRYTREPVTRVEYVAAYPDYYDYRSTFAYDYYPFSPYGFGRLSFQYYDYPYFGPRHYTPVHHHRRHYTRGHHGNHRPGHGHDRHHDGPRRPRPSGVAVTPPAKPTFVPANIADARRRGFGTAEDRFGGRYFAPGAEARRRGPERRIGSNSSAPALNPTPGTTFRPFTPRANSAERTQTRPSRIVPHAPPGDRGAQRYQRPNAHTPGPRSISGRERTRSPAQIGTPARRSVPSATIRPPASQVQAAPGRNPAPARSESTPAREAPARNDYRTESRTNSDSNPPVRTNINDGGRRARER